MQCSLSEISALAQKAACGAGMCWGLSEEAGRAVRWLEAHELPGLALLVELLTLNDGKPYDDLAPVDTASVWQAPNGDLCPFIAGVALCDRAAEIAQQGALELAGTSYPLLLAPFVARAAEVADCRLTLTWSGAEILWIQPGGAVMMAAQEACLDSDHADSIVISKSQPLRVREAVKLPRTGAIAVALSVWDRLQTFAYRTYVPASESSRQSGAGAGLNDND